MGPHAEAVQTAVNAAQTAVNNATRCFQWKRDHPGDVIHRGRDSNGCFNGWWECLRDGRQIAEANTQDMLLDQLDRAFR